jgi:hypothetical protein
LHHAIFSDADNILHNFVANNKNDKMHWSIKRLFLTFLSLLFLLSLTLSAQDTVYKPIKKKKGHDFLQRTDFGGYLGASFGDVIAVNISPVATYHVTKNFHAGIGLTYQYYKQNIPGYPDYSTSAYGGSLFARYFIWRDLFAHIEYAPLCLDHYFDEVGRWLNGPFWIHDFYIGGGYRQMVGGKAYMSLMLLWNVNETINSPYSNPIIRIGFGVGL